MRSILSSSMNWNTPGIYSKWLYFSLKRLLFRPGSWRCVGTMSGGFDSSDHLHPHHHYFLYNNHHRHHDYRFSPPIVMFRPGPALLLVSSDAPTPRSQFLAHYSFTSIKVWSLWGLHDDVNDVNDDTTSVKAPPPSLVMENLFSGRRHWGCGAGRQVQRRHSLRLGF